MAEIEIWRTAAYRADVAYVAEKAAPLAGRHVVMTGATGMLGVILADALTEAGCRVTAAGRSRARAEARLGRHMGKAGFTFIEQDATAPFDPTLRPDIIIPLASNTHPLAYSEQPVETVMTNVLGARAALELARVSGAMVLYPSSVEIYGNARNADDVFSEAYTGLLDLSTARSCYNESKRTSEALCQSYAKEHGVRVRIARLSRLFGPTMLMGDSKASSQFIKKALAGEDIVLKSKGDQLFSYAYAADAAAALLHLAAHGDDGQAYNVSGGIACDTRLRDMAGLCAQWAGRRVVFDLPPETEMAGYSKASVALMNITKLRATGFEPRYTMGEAIGRTLDILSGKR